jgi:transcriptional regulator with XRE-family HTH domain
VADVRLCPACRKTRLSRYNPDPLCAPCMRSARAAPEPTDFGRLVWLWDSRPMREALARLDLAALMAIFRAASGLSQYRLAEITGWSQSSLSLFESGQRETLYDVRALLRFADAVDMPREALLPLVFGCAEAVLPEHWSADSLLADGIEEESGVDVDRRRFGGLMAGTAAAAMLGEVMVPVTVTSSHVMYLKTCVERFESRDQAVGGGALLRQALRQWQRARRMLDESDYAEIVGRDLVGVTGNLAVCAGWLAFDAADVPLARRLYSEALMLAGSAGDPILSAHVLEKLSMLFSHVARESDSKGMAREGLRIADQAAEVARHERMPRLQALIALRRASAVSLLGDQAAFRSAITDACRELDRPASSEDPAWIRFVDRSEIVAQEAAGHQNLGDPATASLLHRESLDAPDVSRRNRACGQAQLALALAQTGDVTAAVHEGMAVLPALAQGVTSVRTLNYLRPIRAAADRSAAEEFCARFDMVAQQFTA